MLTDLGTDAGYNLVTPNGAGNLIGTAGDDVLVGNSAANTMTGGDGADIFVVGLNNTKIIDYSYADGDRLDISNVFGSSGDTLHLVNDGGKLKLSVQNGGSEKAGVTLDNINYSDVGGMSLDDVLGSIIKVDGY
ncbi:MAG: hypothetical protein LBV07_00530 [Syntrophobacterales bacterium]|nr:hypothetical protein [Syntrophobacterales bacterium]